MRTMALDQLKQEGHGLIDELVRLGIRRDSVYKQLRNRLKQPYNIKAGHFGPINTAREAEVVVKLLQTLVGERRLKIKEKALALAIKQRLASNPPEKEVCLTHPVVVPFKKVPWWKFWATRP